ncbi:FAD-dependent monooxygenase [Pseudonocardia broussonetiae]|uniref:Oxidoreductase n=1 Tax=Pseudonocardia broussonetiae TaxID=2736640 RepID=A0A6M6JCC7_9PSEU|nr:FAD-dependent monooxygenase [Pseudonocardia broussonetiae]QJY44502.1 oxidoreductase [Pseudonocardia broussonetiae]
MRRVAVVGGGPGGLYAARLLRLADPHAEVTVHEQGLPETTFGFGVALGARTQRNLEDADRDSLRDILAASHPHDMSMRVGDDVARVPGGRLVAIARTELLAVLTRHAEKAGVDLRYGERVDARDLDADVVVVADGVNSATRTALAPELGERVEVGRGLYLWAGTGFALDEAVFAPARTPHGTFVAHAYPYAPDRSTFLVEVDQDTWRRAGFDATTVATAPEDSDEEALGYLTDAFAGHLGGHRLIGNRTRWLRFRTVTCDRWSHGRLVLLGDAAHTAHYSVGSGTKLAMEDAIALCAALTAEDDRDRAFARYQAERKPAVTRMQQIARRSQWWWDSFPARTHLPVDQLTVAYMTRAGNVSLERFAASSPEVTRRGLAQYADVAPQEVDLAAPVPWTVARPHRDLPGRLVDRTSFAEGALVEVDAVPDDPWGPAADALVRRVSRDGRTAWVTGAVDRAGLLTRLDVAERLRLRGQRVVTEGPPELLPDLAAGLAAGRTDLIALGGNP